MSDQHANDLLAVIHRDGGHHTGKVGYEQSCRDATDVVVAMRARLEELEEQLAPKKFVPYPPGMGEESRRLHREYNALVEAQRNGAKNGPEVVRLTDECADKGIILVPGGENL